MALCCAGRNKELDLHTALEITAAQYMEWLAATGAQDVPGDGEGESRHSWVHYNLLPPSHLRSWLSSFLVLMEFACTHGVLHSTWSGLQPQVHRLSLEMGRVSAGIAG